MLHLYLPHSTDVRCTRALLDISIDSRHHCAHKKHCLLPSQDRAFLNHQAMAAGLQQVRAMPQILLLPSLTLLFLPFFSYIPQLSPALTAPQSVIPASLDACRPFSVSVTPLEAQAQPSQPFLYTVSNPLPCPLPAAPLSDPSMRLPPLAAQAQMPYFPRQLPSFSNLLVPPHAPGADPSVRLPP